MGHEADGCGERKDGAASDGNCKEHGASVPVDSVGRTDAGDGRLHVSGTYPERSGAGGSDDHDAYVRRAFGRCGTLPEAGDYWISCEAGAAKRIIGCDLPFAWRRSQKRKCGAGDAAQLEGGKEEGASIAGGRQRGEPDAGDTAA